MSMIDMVAADPAVSAEVASFALFWGKWFIRLSFAGAVLSLALAGLAAFRDPKASFTGDKPSDILNALKGVLEALAKLPLWVAIFLAGGALLWMAGYPA